MPEPMLDEDVGKNGEEEILNGNGELDGSNGEPPVPGDEQDRENGSTIHNLLELLYAVVVECRSAFRFIGERRPILWALIVFFGAFCFSFFSGISSLEAETPYLARLYGDFATPMFFLGLASGFLVLFISAGMMNLVAQFLGGSGNGLGLFAALPFAQVPTVLAGVVSVALGMLGLSAVIGSLVDLGGVIWMLVLEVVAISEVEELSAGRSVLVFLIPVLAVIAVLVLAVVLFAAAWAPFAKNFI